MLFPLGERKISCVSDNIVWIGWCTRARHPSGDQKYIKISFENTKITKNMKIKSPRCLSKCNKNGKNSDFCDIFHIQIVFLLHLPLQDDF